MSDTRKTDGSGWIPTTDGTRGTVCTTGHDVLLFFPYYQNALRWCRENGDGLQPFPTTFAEVQGLVAGQSIKSVEIVAFAPDADPNGPGWIPTTDGTRGTAWSRSDGLLPFFHRYQDALQWCGLYGLGSLPCPITLEDARGLTAEYGGSMLARVSVITPPEEPEAAATPPQPTKPGSRTGPMTDEMRTDIALSALWRVVDKLERATKGQAPEDPDGELGDDEIINLYAEAESVARRAIKDMTRED